MFSFHKKQRPRFSNIRKAENAVNAEQASVHRLSDRIEPEYKRGFLSAVVRGDDAINQAALRRSIESGDADAGLDALGIGQFALGATALGVLYTDFIRRGANNAQRFLKPSIQRQFVFDPFTEEAARITRERAALLISQVTDESRIALEAILARSRAQGLDTAKTMRLAIDSVGLTQRQALALGNLRSNLVEQGLKEPVIDARIKRQSSKFLEQRARTIARTESTAALNQARNMVWGQLQDQGLIEPVAEKQWITARDERVCFPAFTMIDCENGRKPIQEIKPGDKVRTRDGLQRVIKTSLTYPVFKKMIVVEAHLNGLRYLVNPTKDHPFFVNGQWKNAIDIKIGDNLKNVEGRNLTVSRISIPLIRSREIVYNLQVENDPVYYANGILVHNCEICGPLDNETVPITDTFSSEVGELDSPPAHPGCRCTLTLRSDGTTGRRPTWERDSWPEWRRREVAGQIVL